MSFTEDDPDRAIWAWGVAIVTTASVTATVIITALVCQTGWWSAPVFYAGLWALVPPVVSAFLLSEYFQGVADFFELVGAAPLYIVSCLVGRKANS